MRVFISSTSKDLKQHRIVARDVVHSLGWTPVNMEDFDQDGRPGIVRACFEKIDSADLMLAIVAWRRGWVPTARDDKEGDGRESITSLEIKHARSRKPAPLDVLVLMAEDRWPGIPDLEPSELAYVKDLRNTLNQIAKPFRCEDDPGLPVFREAVRELFNGYRERKLQSAALAAIPPDGPRPRKPQPPALPAEPYPLLRHYEHHDLFAGREGDVAELRRLLSLSIPILGLKAPSGAGKSSVLCAGLLPTLWEAEHPVAYDRKPGEPDLAHRLLRQLLDPAPRSSEKLDPQGFVAALLAARELSGGKPPILILDQFESLLLDPGRVRERGEVGALVAATLQLQSWPADPPCRWVLGFREEDGGRVDGWLRDLLAAARESGVPGIERLPHDASAQDRYHSWRLPVFASPTPGLADETKERAEIEAAFRDAIEKPLRPRREDDGAPVYPLEFVDEGAKHLAAAFAEARLASHETPLVPQLQVVLRHLLEKKTERHADGTRRISVPERPGTLIADALDRHVTETLDRVVREVEAEQPAKVRDRTLLALHRLVGADNRRGPGIPKAELAAAIGPQGATILDRLADDRARIVIVQDGLYELTHDLVAEAVARVVEKESARNKTLALRRIVDLNTALHGSQAREAREQATRLSLRQIVRIGRAKAALLGEPARRDWYEACRRRWLRRAAILGAGTLVLTVALGFGAKRFADGLNLAGRLSKAPSEEIHALLAQVSRDHSWALGGAFGNAAARDGFPYGLDMLPEGFDPGAELDLVEDLLPLVDALQPREKRDEAFGAIAWIVDYVRGANDRQTRDRVVGSRCRDMRSRIETSLRGSPQPRVSPAGLLSSTDWVQIPGGPFRMGSEPGDEEADEDERPPHDVTVSRFEILRHEVTEAEWRAFAGEAAQSPDARIEKSNELPVVDVTWYRAYAFAAWLVPGGRLPTEAEWEYSARGGLQGQRYPWGPEDVCAGASCRANVREAEIGGRTPVCDSRFVRNGYGLCDMAGNAWEWVADWKAPYSAARQEDPWGPPRGAWRVIRGGSFVNVGWGARCANRSDRIPWAWDGGVGFRVVRPAAPSN